jgi:maltose O-acetyltransferase
MVNGPCKGFGKNVRLGNHVNFNGCTIFGGGEVEIGDYFHSGTDVVIFTQDHNWGVQAVSIPYDRVKIKKM